RTPMNGVIGMTDLLLDSGLQGEQREFAETVRLSAETLLSIVNDILDFSKIDARKMDLDLATVDPRTIAREAHEMLRHQAESKAPAYTVGGGEDVPAFVRVDPPRVRQILLNLLGNAIKFTRAGTIELRLDPLEDDGGQPFVRYSVVDTGIGIEPAVRVKLFEPFTQADTSMSRRYGGTGLGLAICKRLTDLLGGEIGVPS